MGNQRDALVNGSRSFIDPDQFQGAIRGGNGLLTFLAAGDFKAELTTIRVGRLTLQRGRENLARLGTSAMPPNVVGILGWYGDGPLPVIRGVQMRRGEWLSLGLGMEAHHRTIGPVDFVSLTLSPSDLARTAIDLIGAPITLTAGKVLQVPEDIGVWLLSIIDAATRVAATTPAIFNSSLSADALEHALLRPMIACIAHGETTGRHVRYGQHAAIAKRFEAAIEANLDKSLPMPALCRSIGVSERRLRVLCQEQFGISPLKFLSLRRLHLARRSLLMADHHSTSVTEVAMEYGFWQLGRFAETYKSVFGEAPSASLRRSRDGA